MVEVLHKFILALISGITEFLPVSASAHRALYQKITGCASLEAEWILAIHIGCLIAVIACNHTRILRLTRRQRPVRSAHRNRGRQVDSGVLRDRRLLKSAVLPLIISIFFYAKGAALAPNLGLLALFLLINGIITMFPRILSQGNKDSKTLSALDGLLIGLGGTVGVIPGFSRVGTLAATALARGSERSYALDFALLLSVPCMIGITIFDCYLLLTAKAAFSFLTFLGCTVAAGLAFGGAFLSITLLRFLYLKSNATDFAFYNWGLALVSFILYLIF